MPEETGNADSANSIVISKLPRSRWPEYRELRLEAMKSDPLAFGSSYEEEMEYPAEVWEKRMENAVFAIFNGKLIGMAGYLIRNRIKTRHAADIFSVYVRKEFRRQGIAENIMKKVLSLIREDRDVIKATLTVSSNQDAAVALYSKMGFKVVGKLRKELKIDGKFYDETLMEIFF